MLAQPNWTKAQIRLCPILPAAPLVGRGGVWAWCRRGASCDTLPHTLQAIRSEQPAGVGCAPSVVSDALRPIPVLGRSQLRQIPYPADPDWLRIRPSLLRHELKAAPLLQPERAPPSAVVPDGRPRGVTRAERCAAERAWFTLEGAAASSSSSALPLAVGPGGRPAT
jgi:hypothetical protein